MCGFVLYEGELVSSFALFAFVNVNEIKKCIFTLLFLICILLSCVVV